MSLLLTKEQVLAGMSLDADGLKTALDSGGYYDNYSMDDVQCLGMNLSGMFVYQFKFLDEDLEMATAKVYVSYKRGPMSREVFLIAEY